MKNNRGNFISYEQLVKYPDCIYVYLNVNDFLNIQNDIYSQSDELDDEIITVFKRNLDLYKMNKCIYNKEVSLIISNRDMKILGNNLSNDFKQKLRLFKSSITLNEYNEMIDFVQNKYKEKIDKLKEKKYIKKYVRTMKKS